MRLSDRGKTIWAFGAILAAVTMGLAGCSSTPQQPYNQYLASWKGKSEQELVVAFGILQLVSAILLVFDSRRHIGAILLCVTFSLSVVMILVTGQIGFAAASIIPVLMAGWVIYDTRISGS